jgi:multicomponent Na+:H+ antiporter subunit F
MSVWLSASIVVAACLLLCAAACLRGTVASALAALNVGSVVSVLLLVMMTMAFGRQPFIDLAVVLAPLSFVGSLAFVRYLGRHR